MESESQILPPCVLCCTWTDYEFNTDYDYFALLKLNMCHKGIIQWLATSVNLSLDFEKVDVSICEAHFDKEDIKRTVNEKGESSFDVIHEMVTPAFTNPSKVLETNRICNFNDLLEGYQKCLGLKPHWDVEVNEEELILKSKINASIIKISIDLHLLLQENNSQFEKGSILETHLDNGFIVYWSRLRALMNFCEDNSPLTDVLVRLGSTVVLTEDETFVPQNTIQPSILLLQGFVISTGQELFAQQPVTNVLSHEVLNQRGNILNAVDAISDATGYKCPQCNYTSHMRDRVIFHMKYHDSQFKCENCNRCFPNRRFLDRHTWTCPAPSNSTYLNSGEVQTSNEPVEDCILPDDGDVDQPNNMKMESDAMDVIQMEEGEILNEPIENFGAEEKQSATEELPGLTWFDNSEQEIQSQIMYCCEYCMKGFPTEDELEQHKSEHFESNEVQNNVEEEVNDENPEQNSFLITELPQTNSYSLKSIMKDQQPENTQETKRYQCDLCDYKSDRLSNVQRHRKYHVSNYKCRYCFKCLPSMCYVKRHERTHIRKGHTIGGVNMAEPAIQEENTDVADTSPQLSCESLEHQQSYSMEFVCKQCGECFETNDALMQHECLPAIMGMFQDDSNEMKSQEETETVEEEYDIVLESSPNQSRQTKTGKNLNGNQRYKRVKDKYGLYKCDFCEFKNRKINSLNQHRKYHISEHKCEKCDRYFPTPSLLNRHMVSHKAEVKRQITKYSCSTCSFKTTTKRKLQSHSKQHLFSCEICKKTFRSENHLRSHLITHKGNPTEISKPQSDTEAVEFNVKAIEDILQENSDESLEPNLSEHEINDNLSTDDSDEEILILPDKDPLDETKLRCEFCEYKTSKQGKMKRHMLCHESSSTFSSTHNGSCTNPEQNMPDSNPPTNQVNDDTIEIIDTDSSDTMDSFSLKNMRTNSS